MIAAATPGWFGKLPSLGDFASRRVDVDFMEAWDGWLAQGLAGWQARDGDAWLTDYLNGPSWRFVLMPGTLPGECGAHAVFGRTVGSQSFDHDVGNDQVHPEPLEGSAHRQGYRESGDGETRRGSRRERGARFQSRWTAARHCAFDL